MEVEKLIRDGRVAVLISQGYGAGWSTWNESNEEVRKLLLFDKDIANAVLEHNLGEATKIAEKKCKLLNDYVYLGGVDNLEVVWVDEGSMFWVEEYDGNETLVLSRQMDVA